ncbi:hypothetical protein CUMW_181650 [Citrus unshiu]|uniref:Uncharacterized protein n=1 Tax=Citrus unshiu TaxID=55188 RepID=A0A2H5PZF3_CITUN|nr:hypothetical protein CUMW_181650 [Citrus unshiu]
MLACTTSDLSCGVPTPRKLSQLRARHNKSSELAIAFNVSHVKYFRKKIAVDIFNEDIVL